MTPTQTIYKRFLETIQDTSVEKVSSYKKHDHFVELYKNFQKPTPKWKESLASLAGISTEKKFLGYSNQELEKITNDCPDQDILKGAKSTLYKVLDIEKYSQYLNEDLTEDEIEAISELSIEQIEAIGGENLKDLSLKQIINLSDIRRRTDLHTPDGRHSSNFYTSSYEETRYSLTASQIIAIGGENLKDLSTKEIETIKQYQKYYCYSGDIIRRT